MSYIAWRKTNEDRVLQKVNDGELCDLPAWKESSTNELTDSVITPLAETIVNKAYMIPMNFACVFAEYLFEEYHVSSADIELFTQVILMGELKFLGDEIERVTKDLLSGGQTDTNLISAMELLTSMMPEDLKGPVSEALETARQAIIEKRDKCETADTDDGPD